ncbi:hypothetical protein SISNIDRAFT_488241 [Sistotremastrum niveocremeum HHB9708]|uniref:Uncharacterized protein n=1 Tax=Sistotremastrum niveocremeum HHB9708 TaxID=1314777 RepID=A0A164RLJ9_9AGAM|nr:hypothetical protein SISNIDRAFT_488241 [Sistotremastrum niveocremeum HHB9708]
MAHVEQRNSKLDFASAMARLLKQKWPYNAATEEGVAVQKLIQNLVIAALSRAKVLYEEYESSSYPYSRPDYLQRPKELLLLCLDTNNAALVSRLLTRLKTPKKDDKQHLTQVALPFIIVLRAELVARGIRMSSDPYGGFCHDVIVTFVDKVLGPQPPANAPTPHDLVAHIGCQPACTLCNDMISRLTGSQSTIEIRRPEKDRKHIERQAAASRIGFRFDTIRNRSPYGLQITKPASLTAFGTWNERRMLVHAVIAAIRDHMELQGVLRDDYARIMALLGLATVPPIPGAIPAPVQAGSLGQPTQPHAQTNTADASGPGNSSGSAPTRKKNKRPPSTPEAGAAPRKRSKKNSTAVIDLCSSSPDQ